jgi:hypothetical protein
MLGNLIVATTALRHQGHDDVDAAAASLEMKKSYVKSSSTSCWSSFGLEIIKERSSVHDIF